MLTKRLVVVSNRLPVNLEKNGTEQRLKASSGGLVTALSPVMEREQGLWIGWLGNIGPPPAESVIDEFALHHNYELRLVNLTEDEIEKYYHGFSNRTLWPLFHDLLAYCKFESENWLAYDAVNLKFAEAIYKAATPDDTVWVHDYQLMLVAKHLRLRGFTRPLLYFLHIPFPSADLFRRLPWKHELIRGLMEYDHLGFQTLRDRRNFIECVKAFIGDVRVITRARYSLIQYGNRTVKVGHYPISIDFDEFDVAASSPEIAKEAKLFHQQFSAKQLALGIDRLDYTKGIAERFLAFERALEKYPDLRGNLSLFQVVVPSRTSVPEYLDLKGELDRLVGRINGWYAETVIRKRRWVPIHYVYGSLNRTQLLSCYRASEIALITPLRDGMNLVAKEYCASQIDRRGVLILSEFAGTADQLGKYSLIVNPYDREKAADTIYQAYCMSSLERRRRMAALRAEVKRFDVHQWVRWFFESTAEPERPRMETTGEPAPVYRISPPFAGDAESELGPAG